MKCTEVVYARGHRNIRATHRTTLEITTDSDLTPRGDCIVGVSANKSAATLSAGFKECLQQDDALLVVVLKAGGLRDFVVATTSSKLLLTDPRKIIIRKSSYIEPATIGIYANKSAGDIRRDLVEVLKDPQMTLTVYLRVVSFDEIAPIDPSSRGVFNNELQSLKSPSAKNLC
ncbi:MAG: DUF371 domain-containing protein [Desulfurococcaceae archaeon]|nr:DUF371 domain-containing protein [Desulfurococcaceae archaeon]